MALPFLDAVSCAEPNHPNIIFILTDDQGYGDLGCYGSKTLRTPHIDRLAAEGLKLTRFYMAGSVCTPSRAALMTGSYPQRFGIGRALMPTRLPLGWEGPRSWSEDYLVSLVDGKAVGMHPNEITLAEQLQKAGYATGMVGKWHLGDQPEFLPLNQGFDTFFGLPNSNIVNPHDLPERRFPPHPLYHDEQVIELNPDQDQLTQRYTEKALEFIRENRNRPFFLYLAHAMPHRPLHVSERYRERFSDDEMNAIKKGDPWSRDFLYPAVIEEIDDGVGAITSLLDELGLGEQTLIVYTSDNGPVSRGLGSAGPFRGRKGSVFEGGKRVPCIIRWPEKVPPGTESDALATAMDFFVTFSEITGAPLPQDRVLDGRSMLPILAEPESARAAHDAFYYMHRDKGPVAIGQGPWKLFVENHREIDAPALFHLEDDPEESRNLAGEHPDVVRRLARKAEAFRMDLKENSRPLGMTDPEPLRAVPPRDVPAFAERLEPVGRALDMTDEGWIVWGVAPIYGPDGKTHVFVARWPFDKDSKRPIQQWAKNGQIVRAVADHPAGPYEVKEVVVEGRGGGAWDGTGVLNPQIHKIDDGYALLYIAARGGMLPGQSIGMMTAPALEGPWKRVSDEAPLLAPADEPGLFDSFLVNNPALVKTPQGKYFLYFKGRLVDGDGKRRIGLAIADRLEGPYEKYEYNPVLDHAPGNYEDPFVWRDSGRFKMLMHDMGVLGHRSGIYFESYDGIHWSEPNKGYPSVSEMEGTDRNDRLETPMILFKDGVPEYLFCNRATPTPKYLEDPESARYSSFLFKIHSN